MRRGTVAQPDNAARCKSLGVGRVVEPHERTPVIIGQAVRDVLTNPTYSDKAEHLREEIATMPGLVIVLVGIGFSLIGDGIADRLGRDFTLATGGGD